MNECKLLVDAQINGEVYAKSSHVKIEQSEIEVLLKQNSVEVIANKTEVKKSKTNSGKK